MKSLFLAAALLAAVAPAGSHPHFDDKGTLPWSEKLADAQKAAAKSGKLIFVEYGRKA